MIRGSFLVAMAAIVLSLILHSIGLSFTAREDQSQSPAEEAPDVTETGAAFEDLADVTTEAEKPDVTPPDPVVAETPTSLALVGSDNPQDVTAPDAAKAEVIEPEAGDPVQREEPVSETQAPSEDADPSSDVATVPPVEPAEPVQVEETPQTTPDATEAETASADPPELVTPDATPPSPEPVAEPPVEIETTPVELPDIVIASIPQEPVSPTSEETDTLSASAVTRSLRPPKNRPTAEELGVPTAARQPTRRATIESPLTVYRRSGVDLLAGGSTGGASGFSGSGGAGNADGTNYAGRVLVHLNTSRVVQQAARGTAKVQFKINPDGSVAWARVLNSSGTPGIRRAATTQVRSSAPFPRPPSGTGAILSFVYRSK